MSKIFSRVKHSKSSNYKSVLITSRTVFDTVFTNAVAMLKQLRDKVASTLFSTLFERRTPTLYQPSVTLKIRRRILFHFQRRINVISMLIHNVETMLIQGFNVSWDVSMQKKF